MVVYVDDYRRQATVGLVTGVWSHLLADTEGELLEFAAGLGLRASWIQYPGTPKVHFDVVERVRRNAIRAGARQITWRESGALVARRREQAGTTLAAIATPAGAPRAERAAHYNRVTQRHSWRRGEQPHWRHCRYCGMHVENRPDPHSKRWFQEWHFDDERAGGDNYGGGPIPKCAGPASTSTPAETVTERGLAVPLSLGQSAALASPPASSRTAT